MSIEKQNPCHLLCILASTFLYKPEGRETGPSISTTEKFGFSIVTTTGFPLQVSFAHQLEKSNLGAIKVWNLEPQTEKVTQKLRTFEEKKFQNPDLKIEK